jgi:hypothetical protein
VTQPSDPLEGLTEKLWLHADLGRQRILLLGDLLSARPRSRRGHRRAFLSSKLAQPRIHLGERACRLQVWRQLAFERVTWDVAAIEAEHQTEFDEPTRVP